MTATLAAVDELAARVHIGIHRIHDLIGADEPWMDADIEADLSSLLEEFERLSVPLPSAEQKLDAVASLVKIHRELDSFDQYLRSGELVGASVSLGEMMTILADFESGKKLLSDRRTYDILQEECIDRQAAIHFQLNDIFKSAYQFKESGHGNTQLQVLSTIASTSLLNFHDNPISLEDLLLALDTSGLLESSMITLAKNIVKAFILDCDTVCTGPLTIKKTNTSAALISTCSQITDREFYSCIDPLLERLVLVTTFVTDHAFTSSFQPPHILVSILYTAIFDSVVKFMRHAITEDLMTEKSLPIAADSIIVFENSLEEKGLWNQECPSLCNFSRTLFCRHIAADSNRVLSNISQVFDGIDDNIVAAPELLHNVLPGMTGSLSCETTSTGKQGKGGLFSIRQDFETRQYKISQRALVLVEAISQHLDMIKPVSTDIERQDTMQLLQTIKNILELYRAKSMQLASSSDVQSQTPMRVMTLYCDCLFICQYLGLLNPKLMTSVQDSDIGVTFTDMVPFFRQMGESVFLDHMDKIKISIYPDLEGALSFKHTNSDIMLKRLVSRINGIAREWKKVAPIEMYAESVGVLVDLVIESLFQQLRALGKIDQFCLHSVRYAFLQLKPLALNFSVSARYTDTRISVSQCCTHWDDYQSLMAALELLDLARVQKIVDAKK
ncbi:hypothetical protein BDV3_003957 [Batrachochytrium dendrobatidis]